MIETYVRRIIALCDEHDIQETNSVFFPRLMFYLNELLKRADENKLLVLDDEDIMYALRETSTMIAIDEDLDGLGMEKMMEMWEKALDIEYGKDYTFDF